MTETAVDLVRCVTGYGAGKVHLVKPSRRPWVTLYCTGRAMDCATATADEVDCKACLKRAARNGIEP